MRLKNLWHAARLVWVRLSVESILVQPQLVYYQCCHWRSARSFPVGYCWSILVPSHRYLFLLESPNVFSTISIVGSSSDVSGLFRMGLELSVWEARKTIIKTLRVIVSRSCAFGTWVGTLRSYSTLTRKMIATIKLKISIVFPALSPVSKSAKDSTW